ncbi:MAG: lysoplasmalogenase, partial [Acidimicrobiia bacterium]|nr:lysoplasmalogenase [Acidimicrobiia bacterium]
FCILGDVFLMLPKNLFVPGLASFAVAQVMFTISFATGDTSAARWIVAAIVAIPVALVLAKRFVGAIRRSGHSELVVPVSVYVVVITTMAVAAVASGSVVAVAGATIFMVSDSLIAETRFVKARPWHSVGIMVTYHLALAGLTLGLL